MYCDPWYVKYCVMYIYRSIVVVPFTFIPMGSLSYTGKLTYFKIGKCTCALLVLKHLKSKSDLNKHAYYFSEDFFAGACSTINYIAHTSI